MLHLTLDRPKKRNAIDDVIVAALLDLLEAANQDDSVRAVLLDGSGDDFCSGFDIVGRNAAIDGRPRVGSIQRRLPSQAHRLVPLLLTTQVPVVCAVRGWAAGLGFHLALASDFCVAASDARFWEPFTTRGFTPDSGGTWLLPRLVAIARAKELLLLGRELSGDEAAAWGVIHRAVPPSELDAVVHEVVDTPREGSDGQPRADEVARPPGRRARPRAAPGQRGVRDGALVAQRPTSARGSPRSARSGRPASKGVDMITSDGRVPIDDATSDDDAVAAVRAWIDEHVPAAWRDAAAMGGVAAIRAIRSRADYESWYPVFGRSGLVAPTWPAACGGLDVVA